MPVITLSRQKFSGGDEVARVAAERLGLRIVGRSIINQAARQAGVPEVALATLDELGLLGLNPCSADCERYAVEVAELMASWAEQGDVLFVGRGSQVVLAGRPGVLHVQVIAPLSLRIERVCAGSGVPVEVATALIERRDHARAAYVQRYYGRAVDDPQLYDMTLNLAHLSLSGAADLICQAAERAWRPAPASSPTSTAIEVSA